MKRRSVLGLIGGSVGSVAGCLGGVGGCPKVDLENERPYEVRTPEWEVHDGPGIDMVQSRDGIDDFVWDDLTDADERWIAETDFDESFVLALKESAGGTDSSEFEILGVEQESNRTVHAYSCIAEIAGGDVGYFYARLLRVPYDTRPPEKGRYTHWEETDDVTYETGQ